MQAALNDVQHVSGSQKLHTVVLQSTMHEREREVVQRNPSTGGTNGCNDVCISPTGTCHYEQPHVVPTKRTLHVPRLPLLSNTRLSGGVPVREHAHAKASKRIAFWDEKALARHPHLRVPTAVCVRE
eukprot:153080-Rhodomonas_salina.1